MEIALLILSYGTMLMYFDWLYRLFTPCVKFLIAFLSFFLIIVLIQGSINIFIIPIDASLLRMLLPHIVMFIWSCICFKDSIDFKLFGCLMQMLITSCIEVICMVIYFLLTKERMLEILNDGPVVLMVLRIFSILCNLAAYEFFLYVINKNGIKKVIYPSILLPLFAVTYLIGNCIQYITMFGMNNNLFLLRISFTGCIIFLLSIWILYAIHLEFQKKKIEVLQTEIEQNYQDLLDEYMNVNDFQMLQKYLRHDFMNHIQVLNEMENEEECL